MLADIPTTPEAISVATALVGAVVAMFWLLNAAHANQLEDYKNQLAAKERELEAARANCSKELADLKAYHKERVEAIAPDRDRWRQVSITLLENSEMAVNWILALAGKTPLPPMNEEALSRIGDTVKERLERLLTAIEQLNVKKWH